MYSALDVARYVINYSNEKEYGITNLKLQKVLYFIQAWFLKKTGKECFDEKIEAWNFGPVIPEVYREFKRFGSCDIPTVNSYYKCDSENIWETEVVKFNSNIIKEKDRDMIKSVVDKLSDLSASYLVKVTHRQTPWKNAYIQGENSIISTDDLRSYFCHG